VVIVAGLLDPRWTVEIEAEAILVSVTDACSQGVTFVTADNQSVSVSYLFAGSHRFFVTDCVIVWCAESRNPQDLVTILRFIGSNDSLYLLAL
jgi:hypothetical protein